MPLDLGNGMAGKRRPRRAVLRLHRHVLDHRADETGKGPGGSAGTELPRCPGIALMGTSRQTAEIFALISPCPVRVCLFS